ncbi:hypothetical protein ATANTOWER_008826 [Ataeniobius toweri]|uniref:Uncharacterized protein n=1 Tax=Ataeniobius toweri TaxID=208326 RepID=A0ABU7BRP6_9TELE|nr:hypothetical protein [Ataeniobius toweri]
MACVIVDRDARRAGGSMCNGCCSARLVPAAGTGKGPHTDQGALTPATLKQVKRQLSVIVNVDIQHHNGKINGPIGDINLDSTRPLLLGSLLL